MSGTSSNRRRDTELRDAIDRLHQQFQSLETSEDIYKATLRELSELTASPVAFLLQQHISEGESLLRCVCAIEGETVVSPEAGSWPVITLCNDTRTLFGALTYNRCTLLEPTTMQALRLPREHGWPELRRVLVIPLGDHQNARGLMCVANADQPYHVEQGKRVWPLLATCASVAGLLDNRHLRTASEKHLLVQQENWRALYHQLELVSPLGMITLNADDHTILRLNPAAERMFGVQPADLLGQPITRLVPERYPHQHRTQTLRRYTREQFQGNQEISATTASGETISLELTVMHYDNGNQHNILLLLRDATALHLAQNRHESELQRFRALADLAPLGILRTTGDWETEYTNSRWQDITGMSANELQGLNWTQMLFTEDAEEVLGVMHARLGAGQEFKTECRIQTASQEEPRWTWLQAVPLFDLNGDVNGFLATLQDNSSQHEAEDRLRHMAERDALTGLANRTLFFDRLEHALQRVQRHGSLALLALDLDGFKNINDSLGHDAGDQILVEVSKRLLKCVREEDTVARVGGDEFYILLEGLTDASVAAHVSDKILQILTEPFMLNQQELFVTTSIGICFAVAGQHNTVKSLLKQADLALYRAKDAGRNNYQYYSPDLEKASRKKLELGNSLHRALGRAEFEVYYQAQARVSNNRVVGFEALLRWQHPTKGILPPDEFIPLLEETGLILPVSRWLFHVSFQQLRKWIDNGLVAEDCIMAVNISPRMFRDRTLVDYIASAVSDARLKGSNIEIEITETALIQEHLRTRENLLRLRETGVRIALDDFGTGYSSLSYLKKYPIDKIKIDRAFVKDILVDNDDAAITQAVLALARSLRMEVTAEGVEDEQVLMRLREWDCDTYQGFLLNAPTNDQEMEIIVNALESQTGVKIFNKE